MEAQRTRPIKDGETPGRQPDKSQAVKNKVASPFGEAEFDTIYPVDRTASVIHSHFALWEARNRMKFQHSLLTCVCLLSGAINGIAESTAYVVMTYAPTSVTPFNIATGRLGAAGFVPMEGYWLGIPPAKHELWELTATSIQNAIYAINILDPDSYTTLATIPLDGYPTSLTFDPSGTYAYVSGYTNPNNLTGELMQIDVASRVMVQSVNLGRYEYSDGFQLAFSSDESTLFLPTEDAKVLALSTASLSAVGVIPTQSFLGSLLVSGTTLLIPSGNELLYVDTKTLRQTKSVGIPLASSIFGISADQTKIYTYCYYANDAESITVIDFASGTTLLSQAYPQVDLENVLLSPDGTKILIGSSPVVLVDSADLTTLQTVISVGIADSAVFLTSDDALLLNAPTDAMASIDQSSHEITSMFPIGLGPSNAPLADPKRNAIYVGGYYYQDGSLNVISPSANRLVQNLPVYGGLVPGLATTTQLYGVVNGGSLTYNFAQKTITNLPPPIQPSPNHFTMAFPGSGPPSGETYWVPFQIYGNVGDDDPPTFIGGIAIYNTATNAVADLISLFDSPPGPLAFSPDSSKAYFQSTNHISVIDAHTFRSIATFQYPMGFDEMVVSPDGLSLYAHSGAAVYVLDAKTGIQKNVFPLPDETGGALSVSADGKTLFLTDGSNSAVDLIDTGTGQVSSVIVPYLPTGIAVVSKP